jgi:hypothetical protein
VAVGSEMICRLVADTGGRIAYYITLCHSLGCQMYSLTSCDDKILHLLTTKVTLTERTMNTPDIPWSESPKSFKDTDVVASKLGIQYFGLIPYTLPYKRDVLRMATVTNCECGGLLRELLLTQERNRFTALSRVAIHSALSGTCK